MSERQIELVWRCSSCNHQSLGRFAVCQGCGNPKDDSEEYEMPADPSAVASVTDPALLRLARAGENWSCAYCESDQRALDGSCGQCGAGKAGTKESAGSNADVADVPERARAVRRRPASHYALAGLIVFFALVVLGVYVSSRGRTDPAVTDPTSNGLVTQLPGALPPVPLRTEFDARVTAVSWRRGVTVETFQLVAREDFTSDIPPGAVEVRAAGQHHHHDEQVFDHNDNEYYEVEVPDGTRSESYTERVSCGQDCKTTPRTCKKVCSGSPRSCRQKCTNNKNGFATCREECTGSGETCRDDCSGGGQTCTPKYCTESRTRKVPKTRQERRSRIVARYRSEPRTAPWSTYKIPEWTKTTGSELTGEDTAPRWPDAGVAERGANGANGANGAPKLGEKRVTRTETSSVSLLLDDGSSRQLSPSSDEELKPFLVDSKHRVRVESGVVKLIDASD